MTIFNKIMSKEIPAQVVYEDELCLAFRDINPQAPVHVLLIPKKEIPTLNDLQKGDAELMGHLLLKVPEIAKKLGIADEGYRIVMNTNANGGQTVHHIHIHILGGRELTWPPG